MSRQHPAERFYETPNPDYDKTGEFVNCMPARQAPPDSTGFPLAWARPFAPIEFALYFVLILYFVARIVAYIRKR